MGKIQELPKSSSRLLTSSQIISSLYCVVKELVENAIDSGAKNVEIKLEDYGLEKIEVKDNGFGIDKNDIHFVAKPHFTSKLTSYLDLDKIQTYGFRGEALGSICTVADLVIITKSAEESVGLLSNFGHDGQVTFTKPYPCSQGTTISVLNLFKSIPVRRQFYRSEKNKKEELRKVEELLVSYGCIQHDIRFVLYHNRNLIWQKPALTCTKNALVHVLGNAVVDHMKYITHFDEQNQRKTEIYLPAPNAPLSCGFSSFSRCIVSVNRRPVRMKAFDKLLKDYYNKSIQNIGRARYPVCYVSLTLPPIEVDVNVEPNKTSIMLHHSEEILANFSNMLKDFYCCETTEENNVNKNVLLSEISALNQEKSSSASDFLSKLKTTCDTKLQQSKLPCTTDYLKNNEQTNNSMSKKDIVIVNSNEPCKKKLKTCSQKSKGIDNYVSTLKEFFSNETQMSGTEKSTSNAINGISAVTVQRVTSGTNTLDIKESSIVNGTDLNQITTFAVSRDFNTDKMDSIGILKRSVSDVTTPAVKNCFEDEAPPSAHVEKQVSDILGLQLTECPTKNLTVHTSGQNEAAWSRGMLSTGEHIEPVAVLQPKCTTTLESNCKEASNQTSLNKSPSPEHKSLSFERKLTGFDVFCRRNRLEVATENPEFSNHQIAQVLSERWSRLSAEEKAVFKNMLTKDYPKEIKKKEKLGLTVSQNLSANKKSIVLTKKPRKMKVKLSNKIVKCSIEEIKASFLQSRHYHPSKDSKIINLLLPGIWICSESEKLSLLNTFRLHETVIYHRLLETFRFESEPLDASVIIPVSHLGEETVSALLELRKIGSSADGRLSDEHLTANGFDVRLVQSENNQIVVELLGIANCSASSGISDLKELLLLIKKKGYASKLSECRPAKILAYLQSEASRMSKQSPACHRRQDVEDLLHQKELLLPNWNECIHHKPFFSEIWHLNTNEDAV